MDKIHARMWHIDQVREALLKDNVINSKLLLQKQVETLVLKLAKPAIYLFLKEPRSEFKKNTLRANKRDIIILDMFYKEDQDYVANEANEVGSDANEKGFEKSENEGENIEDDASSIQDEEMETVNF